jgi:hypothetical protein
MVTRVTGARRTERVSRKAQRRGTAFSLRSRGYFGEVGCRAPTGLCAWIVCLCVAFGSAGPLLADARSPHPDNPKAIIVVLHGVSWEELGAARDPALQDLLRRSAVGVMNSRRWGPRSSNQYAPYITIGAGRGAVDDDIGFGALLPWVDRKRAMDWLREANRGAHSQAEPGLLGTLLRERGLSTGLLTVGGDPDQWPIPSFAVVGDEQGKIDHVGYARPQTFDRLFRQTWDESDFLAIDVLATELRRGDPPQATRLDAEAVAIIDRQAHLFGEIERGVDSSRDLLIITSPTCPPYESPKDISYAPIAVIGPGFGPGLLTSPSSRRPGMVSNVDIAPTVLRFFGIDARRTKGRSGALAMSGRPIAVVPAREPLRDVLAISRRGVRLVQLQYRLAPVYALGQFFAFLGVGLALAFAPACARRSRRRLRIVLLLAMSLPLALLFLGPFDPGGLVQPYIIVAALAGALTWLSWRESAPLNSVAALLSVTAAVVILDSVTGDHLLYNFIINFGALATRMYGMHNETMGFVVACAAVGGAGLVQALGKTRWSLWSLGVWFALVTAVIAVPFWGANFGGGVTAAFAFAVAYLGVRAGRPRLRHWAAAIIPAVAVGALVVAAGLLGGPSGWTHVADSAHIISDGGIEAAADIAARKAALAWHVMQTIPALSITVALCVLGTWLALKPPARLRAAFEACPSVWAGLTGGFAGAVVGIIVNDSGLVAASSAIGITASAMAYVALGNNGGARD